MFAVLYLGEDCGFFSVEAVHNGFFCGLRANLDYVSGTSSYFDNLTVDTWSISWINEILRILGHERDERTSVYWLLPGKDITDGLVLIEKQSHIRDMINASKYHKTLVLFVDHTNFLKGLRPDVIVGQRTNPRPPVAAHLQGYASCSNMPTSPAESSHSSAMIAAEEDDMHIGESDVSDTDEDDMEFYDSDFDCEDGDDDLFADNVDKSVNDYNEKELCVENEHEDALDDDALNIEGYSRKNLMINIKAFNPEVDMDNPTFKIGMLFSGVEELRKAVTTYAIRNRVKIKKLRNETRRFEAVCAPGCTWMIKASRRGGWFIVTAYEGTHHCEGSFPVSAITAKILTEKFMHKFRDNQKLDLKSFAAKVLREYKMYPDRWKLARARKAALLQIHGDEEGQFKQLMDYGQELRRSNSGSKFFVTTNSVNDPESPDHREHLATVYWSYDACKRGFLAGCRPLICLDGCHIKTKYKGHRGETLKNSVWAVARSTSVPKYKRSMDKLKAESEGAYSWIEELVPTTWIKAFFSEFPKCDMLLNNHSEVFNSYILEAREMPFLSMLETIFYKILQRTESKQKEAEKMKGSICPKIKKKLDKFIEWSNEYEGTSSVPEAQNIGRGRKARPESYKTGPGSLYHLMVGDEQHRRATEIPDLNVDAFLHDEANEVPISQNATAPEDM
ncbi:hypothetical protein ACQ4PT_018059 [Festuca glaucescens]